MNGHNKYLAVGVFIVVGIGLLIMLSLMFSGGRSSESNIRYSLLFQRDISGLTLGAPVKYLGVEVGEVIDMSLITGNATNVKVDLELLESTPVNSTTFASLSFQGVTGVAFISLASDDRIPLTKISKNKDFKYPVIPTRDVGLAALLADGPEITIRLTQFLDRANVVLNDKNINSISNTLANIDRLTTSLSSQENTIREIPRQLKVILEQVEKTVQQLQSTIDQARPDFLSSMDTLNKATASLEKVTVRLDKWAVEHEGDIDKFISGGLAQAPALISDTRLAVRELQKLLNDFRSTPSQLIYKPNSEPVVVEP